LGTAAELATVIDGHVTALTFRREDIPTMSAWGADDIVHLDGTTIEEDVSRAISRWSTETDPWALLLPSTAWGRQVAGRVAARLGAGLTGDAIALEVKDERLVAWKAAFGGQLVVAIHTRSPVQLVTVRVGVLARPTPRPAASPGIHHLAVESRRRVRILARSRDDDLGALVEAAAVIGVGRGVDPSGYDDLAPLLEVLHAELGATRKVTDAGWLPRARQIGITGRNISPRLFMSIGASGSFNHMIGVRNAGTVLALNRDPDAAVFDAADIGIVGEWQQVVPLLIKRLDALRSTT
jgi:electron transfer flavoprotein alpha subunit